MIADLLEAHEEGEHEAAALDALGGFELFGELVHAFFVEDGLAFSQRAPGGHFGFVRQIRDDAPVGFEAAQNEWAGQLLQVCGGFFVAILNGREKLPFETNPEISKAAREIGDQLGEQGRLLLRYSGTENLARVMIEGENQAAIETQAHHLAEIIRKNLG